MSRRQDLVLARMRLLAMRWAGGSALEWPRAEPGEGAAGSELGEEIGGQVWNRGPVGGVPGGRVPAAVSDAAVSDAAVSDSVVSDSVVSDAAVSEWAEGVEGMADTGGRAPRGTEWGQRTPPRLWVSVVTVVVIVAAGIAGVALLRAWPSPVVVSAPGSAPTTGFASGPDPAASGSAAAPDVPGSASAADGVGEADPSQTASAGLTVHVAGPVRHPGLVVLPPGSRVADALAAAGGLRAGADVGETNLARLVSDGERIEIGAADPVAGSTGTDSGTATTAIVDLNTATLEQLDTLPGIGPVTAAKILAWREEHGRFSTVDELAEVSGIGPKTLEELRPHVRV